MNRHNVITILLCLICGSLSSQSWVIDFHGDYPSGRTHFTSGFVDEDGVTFLSGYQGPDNSRREIILMRIEGDGNHTETTFHKAGLFSEAHCIVETSEHHLMVAGRLYDETDDHLLILLYDKDLTLLNEHIYEKASEASAFYQCNAVPDPYGNVIVSTALKQPNEWGAYDYRGVFFKLNSQGELRSQRYVTGEEPDPEYYLWDFRLRQLWYKPESETILCLAPGYGGVMSFITFDSAFHYQEEHPIWRDKEEKIDHTLFHDCYTDYWYSDDEALFFSSRGDYDHNKLRISRVNTQGAFLDYIPLNERPDTIDDASTLRCMATANDSTFYFSFYQHTLPCTPGTAAVYLLNENLEIIGRHIDDRHDFFRTYLVFPTGDGGCITVNDSCNYGIIATTGHPLITKLAREDFETIPLASVNTAPERPSVFPNPAEHQIFIPLEGIRFTNGHCRILDQQGRIVTDRKIDTDGETIRLDISNLKPGTYSYQIYSNRNLLISDTFIKK